MTTTNKTEELLREAARVMADSIAPLVHMTIEEKCYQALVCLNAGGMMKERNRHGKDA